MVQLGELMMILELHRQGLSVTAIARRTGRNPKTVRKYVERGIEAPVYGPRSVGRPSKLAPFMAFLRERVTAFPDLSAARLTREVRELGYAGAYTAVKRFLAAIRPDNGPKPYEVRFETPPGSRPRSILRASFRPDADGFYFFIGRADDMFVSGGENIYPGEVEKLLECHPDIHQAAVVPIDDELKYKKPIAFVVVRPGAALTEAAVQQFALANAAPYLHPRRVWFVSEMPLVGTIKIDRRALAERAAELLAGSDG